MRLRDLDGDREPEVIVDLFTGGAHCCSVSAIYSFAEGSGKYAPLRHNWRDAGYRLQDLRDDGKLELRTRDARFGYRYSSLRGVVPARPDLPTSGMAAWRTSRAATGAGCAPTRDAHCASTGASATGR